MSGLWDSIVQAGDVVGSYTVGAVYRGVTGKPDVFTQDSITRQATSDLITAGAGSLTDEQAAAQATADWDITGVGFNNAYANANPRSASCDWLSNPLSCLPAWLPWALGGLVLIYVLSVLAPYVTLAKKGR